MFPYPHPPVNITCGVSSFSLSSHLDALKFWKVIEFKYVYLSRRGEKLVRMLGGVDGSEEEEEEEE
ncbi:hypothetical protein E2C01_091787 [Portunus trituberculatus]|uniref:Uncharacterized protein n=1 Tax=Portunus trituberculatus TaxID=210409 RepID=A0A5B7JW05_PORTR|nr:hypothetical protein [Portunus trituberculatus]